MLDNKVRGWLWLTLAVALGLFAGVSVQATMIQDATEASRRSLQNVNSLRVGSLDMMRAVGGIDDTLTYRVLAVNSSGEIIIDPTIPTSSTFFVAQVSVTGTCTAVQLDTTVVQACIFNQSTTDNTFCSWSDACTTANGTMIEPRTGRCFPTSDDIYCIRGSSTNVTVDVTTYYQ